MNEERLLILRMVAEGKLSPEDALKLLQALEATEKRAETEIASWQQRLFEQMKAGAETLKQQAATFQEKLLKEQRADFLKKQLQRIQNQLEETSSKVSRRIEKIQIVDESKSEGERVDAP